MLESGFPDAFIDDASTLCNTHKDAHRLMQTKKKTWIWLSFDVTGNELIWFRRNDKTVIKFLHKNTHLLKLSRDRFHMLWNKILNSNTTTTCSGGNHISPRF